MATFCLSDTVTVIGPVEITGTGDSDEVVSIEIEEDLHSTMSGGDGVGYARAPYLSAKVTIRLRQDSTTNDALSTLYPNFGQGKSGSVSYPWMTKDLGGLSVGSGTVKLLKPSSLGFGKELKVREWIFHCAKVAGFVGGNAE
ncbi:MAG: phage protein [Vibrio sp.]